MFVWKKRHGNLKWLGGATFPKWTRPLWECIRTQRILCDRIQVFLKLKNMQNFIVSSYWLRRWRHVILFYNVEMRLLIVDQLGRKYVNESWHTPRYVKSYSQPVNSISVEFVSLVHRLHCNMPALALISRNVYIRLREVQHFLVSMESNRLNWQLFCPRFVMAWEKHYHSYRCTFEKHFCNINYGVRGDHRWKTTSAAYAGFCLQFDVIQVASSKQFLSHRPASHRSTVKTREMMIGSLSFLHC